MSQVSASTCQAKSGLRSLITVRIIRQQEPFKNVHCPEKFLIFLVLLEKLTMAQEAVSGGVFIATD